MNGDFYIISEEYGVLTHWIKNNQEPVFKKDYDINNDPYFYDSIDDVEFDIIFIEEHFNIKCKGCSLSKNILIM